MTMIQTRYCNYYDKKLRLATDAIQELPFDYGLPRELKREMKATKLSWGESVISSYVASLSFDALSGSSLAPSITHSARTSTAMLALVSLVRNACISGVSFYFASKDTDDVIVLTSRDTMMSSDNNIALSTFPDGCVYVFTEDAMVAIGSCVVDGVGAGLGVGSGAGVSVGLGTVDSARYGGANFTGVDVGVCVNNTSQTVTTLQPTLQTTPPTQVVTTQNNPLLDSSNIQHNAYTAHNLPTYGNIGDNANIPEKLKTYFELNGQYYEVEIVAEAETTLTQDLESAIYELSINGLNDTSKQSLELLSNYYPIDTNNSIANFGKIAINERDISSSDFGRSLLSATFENAYMQALKFKMLQENLAYMSVLNKNLIIAQGVEKEYTDSRSGQTVQNLESNNGDDFSGVPTIFAENDTANVQAHNLAANESTELQKAFNGEVLKVAGELGISPSILGVSMQLESHEVESYNKIFNEKIAQLRKELSPQIKRFLTLYCAIYNGDDFDVVSEEISKCDVLFENTPQIDKIAGLGDAIFKAMDKGINFPQSYVNRMFGISQYEIYKDNANATPPISD